jgi:flagellar hook-associated protein 2
MPAYTLPGLSSGQNTNDIIRQLIELESKPIKRWEKENSYNRVQIQAWSELKKLTVNLQTKTNLLISYTAPFSSKKITSSEEGIISGEANRGAKSGKQKIEIEQLATRHKVAGNKVPIDLVLPEGNFSILSKEYRTDIEFKGGSLEELKKRIERNAQKIAVPAVTKVDETNNVLSLHALQYGEDAALKFLDPNGVLKAAGLVGDNVPEPPPSASVITLASLDGEDYKSNVYENNKENKPQPFDSGIKLSGKTAFIFAIQPLKVDKYSKLEIEVKSPSEEPVPEYLGIGIKFKNGEEIEERFTNLVKENEKFVIKLSDLARGKMVEKVIFSNPTDRELVFAKMTYIVPADVQGAPAARALVPAQNAKFKVDGIEVTRDSNENIRDAIEGVSLNLLKTTTDPVEVQIDIDTSKGMMMVKEFVDAYNSLLKFSKEMTISNKDGRLDPKRNDDNVEDISEEFWNMKNKSGILAGDNAVLQLIAGLKTTAGASYPSSTDPRFKVLSDIGVSTGAVGSSWQEIQEGLLLINEEVLHIALSDNPDSVKELFASDNNSDTKPDDGVGYKILNVLKPYNSFKSGVINTKIKLIEENTSQNGKKIKDYQTHLVSYERKLKMKFQSMEKGVGKHKAIGNYLKNNYRHLYKDGN